MIDNIQEFCQIGRDTICDNLKLENCTSEQFEEAIDLVINEFSNYQILSLLINEKLPKEKNNIQQESILIENLNNTSQTLTEDSIINKIKSNLRNAKADFLDTKDKLNSKLKSMSGEDESKKEKIKKVYNSKIRRIKNKISDYKDKYKNYKFGDGTKKAQNKLKNIIQKRKEKTKELKDAPIKKAQAVADKSREAYLKHLNKSPDEIFQRGKYSKTVKQLKQDLKKTWTKKSDGGHTRSGEQQKKANRIIQNINSLKSKKQTEPKKGIISKVASKAGELAKSKTGKIIGGLALATMIAYGAHKIYKNYFSKAAKACAGQDDKSGCMAKYKTSAIKAQISKLRSESGKCSKSKDPTKCKASIQNKINKLKSKLT